MKKLEELEFIKLKRQLYVKCVNRNNDDFKDLTEDQKNCTGIGIAHNDEELTTCNNCNRVIRIQEKNISSFYIIKIMCLNIRSYLIEIIRDSVEPEISDESHILVKNSDRIHKVCFLDLCHDITCKTSFYYGDGILYTYCDYNERINAENVIWIIDLLSMEKDAILDYIISKSPFLVIENIDRIMNEHIDAIDPYQFEDLITLFLNYIRSHPKELNKGKTFLNKYSSSIIGSFVFKIGGAGRVDGRIINLKNYLEIPFKSDFSLEYKHSNIDNYKVTQITHKDIKQLIAQSFGKPSVLFSNRNSVVGNSIDDLHRYKQETGFWKYIVIHRPLLKLFISLFIPEFWKDPKCIVNS